MLKNPKVSIKEILETRKKTMTNNEKRIDSIKKMADNILLSTTTQSSNFEKFKKDTKY